MRIHGAKALAVYKIAYPSAKADGKVGSSINSTLVFHRRG